MDCRYITSAMKPEQLPELNEPEVAFIGRSNAGKSSLINALLQRNSLARTGRTPGQTQMINFFSLNNKLTLADLPGYGYSAIDRDIALKWQPLVEAYVRRPQITEFFFLMDHRRELDETDEELMFLLGRQLPLYVLLTKADKSSKQVVLKQKQKLIRHLEAKGIAFRKCLGVSSLRLTGIEELRRDLLEHIPAGDQSI